MNHGIYVAIDVLRRRKRYVKNSGIKTIPEYIEENYDLLVTSDGYYVIDNNRLGFYVTTDGLGNHKKYEGDIGEKATQEYIEKNYEPQVTSDRYNLITNDGYQFTVRISPLKYEKGDS